MEKIKKIKKDYLKKLELKSNLKVKDKIEKIIIIQNKYLLVKSFNEIAVYLVDSNKLKFKISLNEEIKEIKEKNDIYEKRFNDAIKEFIFDYNFKLRIINYEKKTNSYRLITDKYLIEVDFDKNKWKIINKLKKGVYLFNLDVLNDFKILDPKGKLKKKLEFNNFDIYEIKGKYLIINSETEFLILDIKNNYKKLYSKKQNSHYDWMDKHLFILNDQTIIFSATINSYVDKSENFIFLDLKNLKERSVYCYFDIDHYDSCNKVFITHQFENNIYLQLEKAGEGNIWTIVKEDKTRFPHFICIKSLDDKKLLGDYLHFLSNNLIISWNCFGNNISFIHYE